MRSEFQHRFPATPESIRLMAITTLGEPPFPQDPGERERWAESLTDEFGARPRCVAPLLARLTGTPLPRPSVTRSLDESLWWNAAAGPTESLDALAAGDGPLSPEGASSSIEVRTECELSALHALSVLAISTDDRRLWTRARSAAAWLTRELQPDNATGRPWGVHVFVRLSRTTDDPEAATAASLYADTLLHNCMVSQGRPDRISACILLDAARTLGEIDSAHPDWL